jgi:hypothetical protein
MNPNMIFSIVIVILLIFIFFWAVQCHKQSEYEYYSNNQLSSMSNIISGLKPPTKEDKEAMAKCLNAAFNTNEYKAEDMSLMKVAKKFVFG